MSFKNIVLSILCASALSTFNMAIAKEEKNQEQVLISAEKGTLINLMQKGTISTDTYETMLEKGIKPSLEVTVLFSRGIDVVKSSLSSQSSVTGESIQLSNQDGDKKTLEYTRHEDGRVVQYTEVYVYDSNIGGFRQTEFHRVDKGPVPDDIPSEDP